MKALFVGDKLQQLFKITSLICLKMPWDWTDFRHDISDTLTCSLTLSIQGLNNGGPGDADTPDNLLELERMHEAYIVGSVKNWSSGIEGLGRIVC